MFEAEPTPVLWKPHRPVTVDAVVDYSAFAVTSDCCLLHCQSKEAKAWCKANIANLASLIWGEAICLKATEIGQVTWAMRQAGLKVSELGG